MSPGNCPSQKRLHTSSRPAIPSLLKIQCHFKVPPTIHFKMHAQCADNSRTAQKCANFKLGCSAPLNWFTITCNINRETPFIFFFFNIMYIIMIVIIKIPRILMITWPTLFPHMEENKKKNKKRMNPYLSLGGWTWTNFS